MNKLLTKILKKKRWQGEDKFILCNNVETVDYLFVHCSVALCLWN
jgi:hypothetical protein